MFHEVDGALRALLTRHLPAGTRVAFDLSDAGRPDGDGLDGSAAVVVLSLYDIREEPTGRGAGWDDVRQQGGPVAHRRLPCRRFQVSYLVTAHAASAEREHLLLGAVLAAAVGYDVLPADCLEGSIADSGLPVPLRVAHPAAAAPPWDLWSSLGIALRAGLDLVVTAPLLPGVLFEAAAPPRVLELDTGSVAPVPWAPAAGGPSPDDVSWTPMPASEMPGRPVKRRWKVQGTDSREGSGARHPNADGPPRSR